MRSCSRSGRGRKRDGMKKTCDRTTPAAGGSAYLASIATAVPPLCADQGLAAELIRRHFGTKLTPRSLGLIRATFDHPSIKKRHFAIDDPSRIMEESPDQRIARFTEKSVELSALAVTRALEQ